MILHRETLSVIGSGTMSEAQRELLARLLANDAHMMRLRREMILRAAALAPDDWKASVWWTGGEVSTPEHRA
jgi:hypothetical protein